MIETPSLGASPLTERPSELAQWLAADVVRWGPPLCGVALYFDGKDVADRAGQADDVLGYGLETCPGCGLRRFAAYPVCCELAALAAAG